MSVNYLVFVQIQQPESGDSCEWSSFELWTVKLRAAHSQIMHSHLTRCMLGIILSPYCVWHQLKRIWRWSLIVCSPLLEYMEKTFMHSWHNYLCQCANAREYKLWHFSNVTWIEHCLSHRPFSLHLCLTSSPSLILMTGPSWDEYWSATTKAL